MKRKMFASCCLKKNIVIWNKIVGIFPILKCKADDKNCLLLRIKKGNLCASKNIDPSKTFFFTFYNIIHGACLWRKGYTSSDRKSYNFTEPLRPWIHICLLNTFYKKSLNSEIISLYQKKKFNLIIFWTYDFLLFFVLLEIVIIYIIFLW